MPEREWNSWAKPHPHAPRWHRVLFDSRRSTALTICGRLFTNIGGMDVMDYRFMPDMGARCLHCAPIGWTAEP